jgi:hypothetical protein
MFPGRVPIIRPSSAVKPIELPTLRPWSHRAHAGAAAEMGHHHAPAGDFRRHTDGRVAATYSYDRP